MASLKILLNIALISNRVSERSIKKYISLCVPVACDVRPYARTPVRPLRPYTPSGFSRGFAGARRRRHR